MAAGSDTAAPGPRMPALTRVRRRWGLRRDRAVDLFAAEIGMDPTEVRRRNMVGIPMERVAVQGDSVGLVNMASTPLRAAAVEQALAGGASVAEAASRAAEGTSPPTSTRAAPTGSTWPESSSPAPWRSHTRGRDPASSGEKADRVDWT